MDWLAAQVQGILAGVDEFFRWLVGAADGKSSYELARWVFLRALGVIYLIAFVSLWLQLKGLIGPHGILPADDFLVAARRQLGSERFHLVPTVFWLDAGPTALHLVCGLGVLCSVLLILNVWPVGALACLWLLYLSLAAVGRDFLAYQWDVLLLEAGLLAILFAPGHLVPRGAAGPVSALALFLLWWLLFRLTFESGIVKLTSGDPTWRNLTALHYHFWTQPLPTWTAWYVNLLPGWTKKLMVLGTYLLEIGVPLLIFGPRPVRLAACAGMIFLQLLIFGTGNYNFFNLLTIALALLLVDDAAWRSILPERLVHSLGDPAPEVAGPLVPVLLSVLVGACLFVASSVKLWLTLFPYSALPRVIARPIVWVEPFRSINNYGLFRVMTTQRPEVVVEGSDDGTTWRAYEFTYKPGDVSRRPAFVEPHQPRLDWQMWFAALSRYEHTTWFQAFLTRLLEGTPEVLALMRHNPFPDHPPKYARALLYEYRFTTFRERRDTGAWWTRTLLGAYSPVVRLGPEEPAPGASPPTSAARRTGSASP
jgi:lipase maturation factor 1